MIFRYEIYVWNKKNLKQKENLKQFKIKLKK